MTGRRFYSSALATIARAKQNKNTHEKGRLFESAACSIFTSITGVVLHKVNHVLPDGSQEIDIILRQTMPTELWFMGLAFFIECKCTVAPVPSKEVGFFGEKLATAGLSYGIIFSVKGITGTDRDAACASILRWKNRGKHIISISEDEIKAMQNSGDLIQLCIKKFMALLEDKVI